MTREVSEASKKWLDKYVKLLVAKDEYTEQKIKEAVDRYLDLSYIRKSREKVLTRNIFKHHIVTTIPTKALDMHRDITSSRFLTLSEERKLAYVYLTAGLRIAVDKNELIPLAFSCWRRNADKRRKKKDDVRLVKAIKKAVSKFKSKL